MELTILERWTQYVPAPDEEWFLEWVLRSPRDAGIHLTAGWHAYRSLSHVGPCATAMEYFGGLGAQSLMIQDTFAPEDHVALDYSAEAVNHIEVNVPGVRALQADSYDTTSYAPADIVGLDFGDLTAWKTREGEKHRALLDRVFAGEPKGVVLTDVACRFLHLNRERYESLLGTGTCGSYPDYLYALANRLEELYGYRMVGGYWHRWSTVMALSRTGERGQFQPTPASPLGLGIVK